MGVEKEGDRGGRKTNRDRERGRETRREGGIWRERLRKIDLNMRR